MPTSQELIDHNAGNIASLCPIWKITSRDSVVAAYAANTRPTFGRQINPPPIKATGSISRTAPGGADGDTFTINGIVFTFKTSPSGIYEFQAGESLVSAVAKLNAVIDQEVALASYEISQSSSSIIEITHKMPGVAGNAFTLAKSGANLSVSGSTLTGGINSSLFIFEGTTYRISPAQASRDMGKIGLNPNSTQISGVFDDIITRSDVEGGRWKLAKIVYCYVNYLDLTMGSTGKIAGVAGKWNIKDPTYEVEFLSNATLLQQQLGEITSPTDRNDFPAGLTKAAWTVTRNVVSSADRRHLVIDGAVPLGDYYKYGVIQWTSGNNANSAGMEIKSNAGTSIELQLPMPENIEAADIVTLLAGYDGTREQARDKFANMIDFNGEADLPGLNKVYTYPE